MRISSGIPSALLKSSSINSLVEHVLAGLIIAVVVDAVDDVAVGVVGLLAKTALIELVTSVLMLLRNVACCRLS